MGWRGKLNRLSTNAHRGTPVDGGVARWQTRYLTRAVWPRRGCPGRPGQPMYDRPVVWHIKYQVSTQATDLPGTCPLGYLLGSTGTYLLTAIVGKVGTQWQV
ncbi:hypothetical protein BO71DRAFT_39117 [Aspergillus ellipticus CBS 707.79]|uniref:Uncharacterized protein n=1 Tax=Aspergillus ellipticus CBS 707.79 TaxID=1448320 RepID=A0A319D2Q1_9EURO|nr:hypothetical protein BO71DRAFT_39117 [Aspergillus ellipticus CBS 707.79]